MSQSEDWSWRNGILSVKGRFPLCHGFTGAQFDFGSDAWSASWSRFSSLVGAAHLVMLRQEHGGVVVDARSEQGADTRIVSADGHWPIGDAIIAPRVHDDTVVWGVRTADCVPLLVVSASSVALVHAGWRGLACGVIAATLRALDESVQYVLIGPCAGAARYEVGEEVVAQIGASAQVRRGEEGKPRLDLAQTARVQLEQFGVPGARILSAAICTISDTRFHSYRRARALGAERAGSNLSFIVTGR